MALEPQTYYEETSSSTEAVVAINDTQTLEKRDGQWYGPINADMDEMDEAAEEGLLVPVGKLTNNQFERVIAVAE